MQIRLTTPYLRDLGKLFFKFPIGRWLVFHQQADDGWKWLDHGIGLQEFLLLLGTFLGRMNHRVPQHVSNVLGHQCQTFLLDPQGHNIASALDGILQSLGLSLDGLNA